ncbi:MAG TPA: tetratricopeptide repeat protein [Planctomycetota bacterium]|nr:tetratricopeptide repeat protein [Planctomycetota bacterium]
MSRRRSRAFDAATVAVSAGALSQLPALGSLAVLGLGTHDPWVRGVALAVGLAAVVVAGRVMAARLSDRTRLAVASAAAMIALVSYGPVDPLAELVARAAGATLGAIAFASWLATRDTAKTPGRQDAASEPLGALASSRFLSVVGLAGPLALAPIAARLASLEGHSPVLAALALVLGLAIGVKVRRVPALALLAPVVAAVGLLYAPSFIIPTLAVASVLAGLALRPSLALALAPLLGVGLEQGLMRAAERTWSPERKMAIAHVAGDTLQSFGFSPYGVVAVVDSQKTNVRALYRDGELLGSINIAKGESAADALTPVLASVLLETLAERGGAVACLGFSDGIAAWTLARVESSSLTIVEPDPSIRAIKDDPGDLFHGAWREGTIATAMPANANLILDLEGALATEARLARAHGQLDGGSVVRVVRDGPRFEDQAQAFARVFPNALVFRAPLSRGVAIFVGGVAHIDTARPLGAGLRFAIANTRLPASDLLGTFVGAAHALRQAQRVDDLVPAQEDAEKLAFLLGDTEALLTVADSASKLGNTRTARALLAAAKRLHVEPAYEIERATGDAFFREGNDREAVLCWNRALEMAPSALSPRLSLAARHFKRKEHEKARALLQGALTGDLTKDAPAHYLLGAIALAKNEFALAQRHFEAADGFEDAEKRAEIARGLDEESKKLSPPVAPKKLDESPKRLYDEAVVILDETAEEEAKYVANCRAKKIQPDDAEVALFTSRREEARALLEKAREKEPENPAISFELGRVERVLENWEKAASAFETAARLDPQSSRALYALGDVLWQMRQGDAALDAYERGLARGPISTGSARVFLACAEILVSQKRYADAASKLEEAERSAPGHPEVPLQLGRIYERLGRGPDAVRAYRRWLDLAGDGADPALKARVEGWIRALER